MRLVFADCFFGVSGKLVTHGGAGYKCTKRLPPPPNRSLAYVTNGRIVDHEWVKDEGGNVMLPAYAVYVSRLKKSVKGKAHKPRGVEGAFTRRKLFYDDGC